MDVKIVRAELVVIHDPFTFLTAIRSKTPTKSENDGCAGEETHLWMGYARRSPCHRDRRGWVRRHVRVKRVLRGHAEFLPLDRLLLLRPEIGSGGCCLRLHGLKR